MRIVSSLGRGACMFHGAGNVRVLSPFMHACSSYVKTASALRSARALLGISVTAAGANSHRELRDAYYQLAKKCHPDSAAEGFQDPKRFNELAEAYALLRDHLDFVSSEPSATTDKNDESESIWVSNYTGKKTTNSDVWSRLFFGSVVEEIGIDKLTLNEVMEAAEMSQGGPDKGGMWDLVHNMSRNYQLVDGNNQMINAHLPSGAAYSNSTASPHAPSLSVDGTTYFNHGNGGSSGSSSSGSEGYSSSSPPSFGTTRPVTRRKRISPPPPTMEDL